ncbi:MAG: hypothetical protein K2O85_07485, partial [Helicobacter sp.]|nr:hypothetical protein [Helicobacter sp.]
AAEYHATTPVVANQLLLAIQTPSPPLGGVVCFLFLIFFLFSLFPLFLFIFCFKVKNNGGAFCLCVFLFSHFFFAFFGEQWQT